MPRSRGACFYGYKVEMPPKRGDFFCKNMKRSSFVCMTVPADFVRAHGHKFQDYVNVQYDGGMSKWCVKVNENIKNGRKHVSFGDGWMDFADFHNIVEGEHLKFTLVGPSFFQIIRVV